MGYWTSFCLKRILSVKISILGKENIITEEKFLKRFVGNFSWAHLDIAGVTWSKKGTNFSRAGGTGFGVRLLDEFVKKYYEDRSKK